MKNTRPMLRGLVVAVAVGLIAFLGACSSPDDDSSQSSSSFTPVTIDHEYGSTEITAKPTRVVTLLSDWTDTLAALNIPITAAFVPKGTPTFSWTPANNAQVVEVADPTQVTVAELAKFNPDLILAGYLGSEDQYNKLKEIAPTIPVLTKGATADTWEQLTTTAGKIFGVGDQAQKLIDDTNGEISTFKSNNAKAQGKTFTFAQVGPTGQVGAINSTKDAAAGLIAQLGFTLNPQVAALHNGQSTRALISPERIDLLNSDLLVVYVPGGNNAVVNQVPGWSNLTAVKNGTVVYLDDKTQPAFSVPSAPSVGFVIDTLNPVAAKL
ncbi:ABC transporter substrate-binding protein [Gordonia polyisoprenivorans]|uniref:ABC transporter substrate-binding protein n=1 Tax=Gordonia polyisoprenivorans TaxID=84595 RepID=UPI000B99F2D3|nr:ABC transporter substrate-binding protein [Gordonia polyisoprenivorans]OZC30487.1 ABC transporter substrate-binding protein [Gordonia polyisoprenivorans]